MSEMVRMLIGSIEVYLTIHLIVDDVPNMFGEGFR